MYTLTSENLSGLGGRMGFESTSINWVKIFSTIEAAKNFAEKDYGKLIEWSPSKGPTCNLVPLDLLCSGDLGFVMYHIKEATIEA
jgi:hypothetical protein